MDIFKDVSSLNSTDTVESLAEVSIKPKNIILFIVVLILMILTIFGNGIVLASWLIYRSIRTPSKLLILLAVRDFLTGVIVIPFNSLQLLVSRRL